MSRTVTATAAADGDPIWDRLKRILYELRLHNTLARLEEMLAAPQSQSRLDWLLAWLDPEARARRERRVERRFKHSKLPARKTLDAFDFDLQPSLPRDQIMDLATLAFVKTGHNVLFAGESGTGKSHLAMALGFLACMANIDVRYTTCAAMLADLNASLADGTLSKALKKYTLPPLLICDEVGLEQVERASATRAGLMQKVLLPRYDHRRSTILTSNLDWEMWGDYFNDHLGATAMIDRLVHHSHVIVVDEGSRSIRYAQHEREVAEEKAKREAQAKAQADAAAKRDAQAKAQADPAVKPEADAAKTDTKGTRPKSRRKPKMS